MSETIPSTDSQESIKSVDWLNKENLGSKFTPEVEQKLKNYLKQKYDIERDKVINIASDELKDLKKQIELSQNPVETVVKFVFGEYIETKLEDEWMNAVSIENTTKWIDNPRLENAKLMLNKVLEEKFKNYDFLGDRKEVIKLAMVNKILKNPITEWVKWYLEKLTKILESIAKLDLSKSWETTTIDKPETDDKASENLWNDIEKAFLDDIEPYFNWFEKIKEKLDNPKYNLSPDQKKNIINNMSYFNNPNEIEKWFNVEIIEDFIESNKDKINDWKNLSEDEIEMLKKYMLDSREKIESTLKMWEMWDKAKEFALKIAWTPWAIWKFGKWFIEWILKIPFLWKIFAIFLWLDPNNSIADFNEQIWSFKSLNLLKSLWVKKDNNWNIVSNWVAPFDKVDFSWIEHNNVKKELKDLIKHKPADKDEKEFIKEAFSKGWVHIIEEKDWKKTDTILKFDLNQDKNIDRISINSEDFKNIIKKGYEKFENTKNTNLDTEKIQEEKAKNEKLETEIDGKISTLDTKKTQLYKELSDLKVEEDKLKNIIDWGYNWFDDFLKGKNEALKKKIKDKQTEIWTIYTDINWLIPSIDQ